MSALAEALVAAQAELPCALGKDADGQIQSRTYRYLTLDKLIAETRPTLTKHGLAIVQAPSYIERGTEAAIPALTTMLQHVGGEVANFTMPLYVEPKTMQGLGAAITYARRYAVGAEGNIEINLHELKTTVVVTRKDMAQMQKALDVEVERGR